MSDVVIVNEDEPAESLANNTIVVDTSSPTNDDINIELVTRLTRVEDAVLVLTAQVGELEQKVTENSWKAEVALTEADIAITQSNDALDIATEPAPESPKEDEQPKSKKSRWWG